MRGKAKRGRERKKKSEVTGQAKDLGFEGGEGEGCKVFKHG